MSATAIIDRIFPYASGFGRTGARSILALMEQGQDELLNPGGNVQKYVKPTDNKGFPPYLLTTAGTYRYDITGANLSCTTITKNIGGTDYTVRAKKVIRVFRDVSKSEYGIQRWIGQPWVYYSANPYSTNTDRITVAEVPVDNSPALENTNASVTFPEDPGTTTTTYFVEFMWEAMRLSSESIPLCMPLDFEPALEDYIMGRIQRYSNGAPNQYEDKFNNYWKPRFLNEFLTTGATKNNRDVQPRTC